MGYHTEGDVVPYKSKQQWKWAYATGQPFARRWAHKSAPFGSLPRKVRRKKSKGKGRKRRR